MSDIEKKLQEPSEDAFTNVVCKTASTLVVSFDKLDPRKIASYEDRQENIGFCSDPHDGGLRAWLAVAGVACVAFATFGYTSSWGVFQAYYEQKILQDSSPSAIAWIGSLMYALIYAPGLVAGHLFDMGHMRLVVLIASVTLATSTMLVSECSQYWHFLLVQGLTTGLSCGFLFTPALSTIPHWFRRRKALAFGVASLGVSVGGTTFPIAVRQLIPRVGFPWTMRILALVQLAALAVTNVCLSQRLPPQKVRSRYFTLHLFRSLPFTLYCVAEFVTFLGLLTA